MLPMGWNQIRQARVSGMNQQQQQQMPYGQMAGPPMMSNQQFNIYRPPVMQPQPQMFPPQMMGNFGMPNPQMMMHNNAKPPEPEGPPPPSPPAPLPSSDPLPPPPPDDGQWWIAEMKNLPSDHHRQELERMVNEKWFHTMTTNQQIECWQHKLHLINKQKKGNPNPNQVNPAPDVSAPSQPKQVYQAPPQVNDLELELRKAREEESNIKQQVITFEKQYVDWKKQFDDWKDKHKSHPNKEQFVQYESQWMTWQKQMTDQRQDYESNLKAVSEQIRRLEQQKNVQIQPSLMQMHDQNARYPRNDQSRPSFNAQGTQRDQHFNQNSQHETHNFELRNQQRFPMNNPRQINPNQSFGPRTGGAPVHLRPLLGAPQQVRPNSNSAAVVVDERQNDQFSDNLGNYSDNYHNNEWANDYQEYNDYNRNEEYYDGSETGYSEGGRNNDGWDDSLSLLPGQVPNRFGGPNRRHVGQQQRFPNPRQRGPSADMHFRGPRPRGPSQDGPLRPPYPARPRAPGQKTPLMDIRTRGPRPALQGLNAKLMSLSNDTFNNGGKVRGQKPDASSSNRFGAGNAANDGIRGPRPRGPRPLLPADNPMRPRHIRPLLGEKPGSFPRQETRFPSTQQPSDKASIHSDKPTDNKHKPGDEYEKSIKKNTDDRNERRDSSRSDKSPAVSQDFAEDSLPDNKDFFITLDAKKEKDDAKTQKDERSEEAKEKSGNDRKSTPQRDDNNGADRNEKPGEKQHFSDEKSATRPEDDYSHYFTDEYAPASPQPRRDSHNEFPRGRGRPMPRGRGRGIVPSGRARVPFFEGDFINDDRNFPERFPRKFPRREEHFLERFDDLEFQRERLPERRFAKPNWPPQDEPPAKPAVNSSGVDTKTIMEKAKELSNVDVENLLSAVKSIKSSSATHDDIDKEKEPVSEPQMPSTSSKIVKSDEAAYLAEERHYESLAKKFDEAALRRRNEERLLEQEILAASALGLQDEDLLLDHYLGAPMREPRIRNPRMRRDLLDVARDPLRDPLSSLREPPARDPFLDPLLRESMLERELLMQEIREMREREEMRQKEEVRRERELMEALTKPIVQAQKIVETIDYSHGIKKEDGNDERSRSPPPRDYPPPDRDPMYRDVDRGRDPMMENRFLNRGPHDPMARHGMPPRFPIDDRMMGDRRFVEARPVQYDPNSSVIVADDVIQNSDVLQKHWDLLDKERESMERKRSSMERRRSSLERSRRSREREEERRNREQSLERLRRMERELKERERMLNERELRLKSPPRRKARDGRSRSDWRPEGLRRSRSPIRRRSRERRFRSRSRSGSPRRGRGISIERIRRDRSPIRGRRRFTSPSGESRQRAPAPPAKIDTKIEPVYVRVEDLLNDPARQQRPKRIVIILRGLPGSGKTHIAKLIRDRETARGVTPRVLGLDDYFMVENEKFEKDPDTQRIVKRKVHEYEYDAAMETSYRSSLFKAFKKTLEDGYFSFVIIDAINDKVSHFAELWTTAKKNFFEVYVAELSADSHVCAKRNTHKRGLDDIQNLANSWEETPQHMIRLDVKQMLQDSEIQEVEMGDVSDDDAAEVKVKKEKMTLEQLAGIPQSKWELMEANERLDKLDGIKKKKLTSSQQHMAEFLSVTDDYVQRSSAPGRKRVRWADIAEKSEQQRLREVGFVVGNTDWSRLVDGDSHADAALNRTKFI